MKINDLVKMGMSPLSNNEITNVTGGGFWKNFKFYTTVFNEFLFIQPLKALGHGFTSGIEKSMK